jgi:hypothetical protein
MPHAPHSRTSAEDIQARLPPSQRGIGRDELVVDQASLESFPASDVPAWTPIHAGAPGPRMRQLETPRELRETLRCEVSALLAAPIASRVELVTTALLDADRTVNRIPLPGSSERQPIENIEASIRASGIGGPELVVGARYDDIDVTGLAVLLGLARVLERSGELAATVRLVAFAHGAAGSRAYARRLRKERITVRGMLALDGLAFARSDSAQLSIVGNLRGRKLTSAVTEAFRLSTDLPTRTVHLPGLLSLGASSDARAFARRGWPAARLASRRGSDATSIDAIDFDPLADVVFGLASVVTRLAGH